MKDLIVEIYNMAQEAGDARFVRNLQSLLETMLQYVELGQKIEKSLRI